MDFPKIDKKIKKTFASQGDKASAGRPIPTTKSTRQAGYFGVVRTKKRKSMFDQLIAAGQLLIAGLSIPSFQPNVKRSIGKKLSGLHYDLTLLYENGTQILDIFTDQSRGTDIDIDEVKSLLLQQNSIISRLLLFFGKKEIQTIISIQAPEISPIRFLLFAKGSRVKFYLDEIEENERRRSDGDRFEWLRPQARVELPEDESIARSRQQLEEINELTEKLRQFIIQHFEINEII